MLTLAACIIAAAVTAIGVVWAVTPRDSSLANLQRMGNIRIGYAVEAPYAFVAKDGRVTGESPEIAREVVARLGIGHISWRQDEFGSLIADLESGRIDVIAAGMFVTAQRERQVAFSVPTFHVREGLLVPLGNPHRLHSYSQAVETPGIRVAALAGSVEEKALLRLGLPTRRLMTEPDALTGLMAVESGVADALALSSPSLHWLALQKKLGRTAVVSPLATSARNASGYDGAFAFRKDDNRLRGAWNAALRSYLGTPGHSALVARFGFTAAEMPGPPVAREIPKP